MKKQIIFIGTMLSVLCMYATGEQSLVVQAKGGGESLYTLSGIQRITFSGSTMNVVKKDFTQTDYSLSSVQKLLFRSVAGINKTYNTSLKAYPNPVKDILNVDGVNYVENLYLYNLTGNIINISYKVTSNGLQINTMNLPQGIYLLQINNQVIKFNKQ